jgi:OmpA-OmpF porin, OOP family
MKRFTRILLKLICVGAGALAAPGAHAQFYLGAGMGQGQSKLPSVNDTIQGVPVSAESDKKVDTSYKLYGGYQFTPVWGLEVGYDDLGNKYSVKGSIAGVPVSGTYKMNNWYVAGTATLPVTPYFQLMGKVGFARNTASGGQICAAGTCENMGSDQKTDWLAGFGGQYPITKNWAARLEYEYYGHMTGDDVWGTGNSGALRAEAWYLSARYAF